MRTHEAYIHFSQFCQRALKMIFDLEAVAVRNTAALQSGELTNISQNFLQPSAG
jgi:hypothetical protein